MFELEENPRLGAVHGEHGCCQHGAAGGQQAAQHRAHSSEDRSACTHTIKFLEDTYHNVSFCLHKVIIIVMGKQLHNKVYYS